MTRPFIALLAGTLFGFGLALAGVLDPATIRGFLDFFGDFDPRLGFVFAGAVAVSAAGYLLSRRIAKPIIAPRFAIASAQSIDARLLAGAALFGIGWGVVGLCPGPAIAGLALGVPQFFVFLAAMLVGIGLHELMERRNPLPSTPGG
jgi:uncharacterized protein